MKTKVLPTLLFVAVASTLLDEATSNDGTGMCPCDYFKKHPEVFKHKKEFMEKYGLPDFSKMASCSADGTCEGNLKCCNSPCGMKCMKPIYENYGIEVLEQMYKEIAQGPLDQSYEMTEDDKNLGMCPDTFFITHPEIKKEMKNYFKKNLHSDEQCKHGEDCSHKLHGKHWQFRNTTNMPDCSVDGDCEEGRRCCQTICGKKCLKTIFTKEDFKNSVFDNNENPRNKRDLESQGEENFWNPENEGEHDNCQGKGGKHGKCKGKGGEKGKGRGKGGKGGKGKGKGKGRGKGKGQGGESGRGQENGQDYGNQFPEGPEY